MGNGNTAIDLARVLKRAGVPEVHVISHNALPCRGLPEEDTIVFAGGDACPGRNTVSAAAGRASLNVDVA